LTHSHFRRHTPETALKASCLSVSVFLTYSGIETYLSCFLSSFGEIPSIFL
jgi:hypothetical protein